MRKKFSEDFLFLIYLIYNRRNLNFPINFENTQEFIKKELNRI